jgi:site-specific DNA recombinase
MVDPSRAERACAYVRVSTKQQADHDVSIPEQLGAIRRYADEKGLTIVEEFVEAGVSGRKAEREALSAMMADALSEPPRFTKILVHNYSRFFRDEVESELFRRRVAANGVEIVSITQEFGEGPGAELVRRITALMDEMASHDIARNVRRAMLENARQGFWNGSVAPIGYRTGVGDLRGKKEKKKLEIDPEHAPTVRLIYDLYLNGDGKNGPLGIKNIVKYLNDHGYRNKAGNKFHVSFVSKILKDEVYTGRAWYNVKDSRTGKIRPKEEWICVSVPPLIDEINFQRIQTQLELRSPKTTAPRLVNSPVLLTGLAKCGSCGSVMRRQTGKSGRYAYYRCAAKIRFGSTPECSSCNINADVLDTIVMDRLCNELLTPERVARIVAEIARLREAGMDQVKTDLSQLCKQQEVYRKRLSNLMDALADGIVEAGEIFREKVKSIEADVARVTGLIDDHKRVISSRVEEITTEQAAQFADEMREKLKAASPALKKRILRSFVSEVYISNDKIAVIGKKANMAEIVTGSIKS